MTTFPVDPVATALSRLDETIARKKRSALPDPAERVALRTNAGLTRHDLASVIGVADSTLFHWERRTQAPRNGRGQIYGAILQRLSEMQS